MPLTLIMASLESMVNFASSYPIWARLIVCVCVLVALLTLVLAPRGSSVNAAKSDTTGERWLVIEGVELFDGADDTLVKLTANVNGLSFLYPTLPGIEWMEVGPDMSPQQFKLPVSNSGYQVRFSMKARSGRDTKKREQDFVSVNVAHVNSFPFSGTYNLHFAKAGVRSAPIRATIKFRIATTPN